ncbi:MAG: aldo/keto reductase, partial [Rhodospirillales bacterium]|nr:aldo/keto reductase [Rhodospirillales bacterium]
GLSNFRAWRIAAFAATCDRLGVPRPIACQPCYNAMDRTPEIELLPCCEAFGLGVVPYSPLARGVLTAKYAEGAAPPADTRAGRNDRRMMQTEFRPESLALAKRVAQRAGARGMSAGQLALNWVLNSAAITSVIAGPRTLAQWTDYLGALDKDFTAEDEAFFDSLVPAGHPSTAGYSDPQYPVAGRRPRVG